MGIGKSVTLGVIHMVSGWVNLRANHRNTYGNIGIGSFGVGNPHLRDEFGVNHRKIYMGRGESVTLGVGNTHLAG